MDDPRIDTEDRKVPTPLRAILIIIASFFFSIILVQIAIFPFLPDEPDLSQGASIYKFVLILGELGLIIIPYFYLKRKGYPIREIFRWQGFDRDLLLLIVAIGLALSILGDELDRLVNLLVTPPEFLKEVEVMLKINSFSDFILLFLGTVIVAALAEESVFRGLLQNSLEKHQNVTKAVIYSSLAWTMIHGILYWAVQIFLIGIILGYLAWRTRSILPSAICHGINNALALFFLNVESESFLSFYEWRGHVSPLILLPAIFVLIKGIQFLDRYYLSKSSSLGSGSE